MYLKLVIMFILKQEKQLMKVVFCCYLQHVTDLSGKETITRVTGEHNIYLLPILNSLHCTSNLVCEVSASLE